MSQRAHNAVLIGVVLAGVCLGQGPRDHGGQPPRERRGGEFRPHGAERMPPGGMVLERLTRMTPEERDRTLRRLPQDRRNAVEKRLRDYESMPEAQRNRLRGEFSQFQQLTPEKQNEVRQLFRRFAAVPEERRRDLRRELNHLRSAPAERREAFFTSEQFKSRYSEEEQKLLQGLVTTLPATDAHTPSAPAPPANE